MSAESARRLIAGVDPGKKGAIALLDPVDATLTLFDMPNGGHLVAGREGVDPYAFSEIPWGCVSAAFIEDVHSMPTDGGIQAFSFGRSRGVIEGSVAAFGVPQHLVSAQKWKREMGLSSDKDISRARASSLFPACARFWPLVKDDGRAEAALLALYGAFALGLRPSAQVQPDAVRHPSCVPIEGNARKRKPAKAA